MNNKLKSGIMGVGALLLLAGAALFITDWYISPYLYSVGALMFAGVQLMCGYEGADVIVKRLRRQQQLGAILLLVTGVLMFTTHNNEWVLCLTIAAIFELYTAFRMPQQD